MKVRVPGRSRPQLMLNAKAVPVTLADGFLVYEL